MAKDCKLTSEWKNIHYYFKFILGKNELHFKIIIALGNTTTLRKHYFLFENGHSAKDFTWINLFYPHNALGTLVLFIMSFYSRENSEIVNSFVQDHRADV